MASKKKDSDFQYSELSRELTGSIGKAEKKNSGIFFTPPGTVHKNLDYLEPYMENVKEVLEPSCGSCEYITAVQKKYPEVNITGIELNSTIYESIKNLETENIRLINGDFLTYECDRKYDLIIGNPPYFVMKKHQVPKSYYDYFDGRPNIFILFIIKSLGLLSENGIISFVLPKNFLNCLYYNKTRQHIVKNYNILKIVECDDAYIETEQPTVIMMVQNSMPTTEAIEHTFSVSDFTIFGTPAKISAIKSLYSDSTTLEKLGFGVNVGNVVWNQCKDILTDDAEKTLLIYSSDIQDNKVSIKKYKNKAKKNYINKKGNTDPLLVINRGYGVGTYNFNYCIINETDSVEYLIENHLICIKYTETETISKEDLIEKYHQIIESFKNEKTQEFIKLYFDNNAINTTELCKILPIYGL